MENNIVKENYLEVLPSQDVIKNKKTNLLPVVKSDNNLLLPVIIKNKELALIEIKKEYSNLKEHKTASVIGFIGVSILIVMSTAIITKNIVNSYCGTTPQSDTTYSIFQMKDDYINKNSHKN